MRSRMIESQNAASIIRDAGGKLTGRTRLQKIAYLLEMAGLRVGFDFEYRHYGPYSDQLADALSNAAAASLINEEEKPANWGGTYSVFTFTGASVPAGPAASSVRQDFITKGRIGRSDRVGIGGNGSVLGERGRTGSVARD